MFDPNSTIGWSLGRLRSTASDLITFLRAPTLSTGDSRGKRQLADVGWLLLLNGLIVLVVAMILFPIMMLLGVEMSSEMSDLFQLPLWQIMLFVVFVGPIMEELIFRIWIVGTPRWLVIFLGLLAWIGGSYLLEQSGLMASGQSVAIAMIVFLSIAVLVCLIRFWNAPVPGWYARIFPFVFWTQALLFGFVHVFNYAGENAIAFLPFVLPQLIGGIIWGYARIRYGWWANIVMHMAYNLIATSGLIYMLLTQPDVL